MKKVIQFNQTTEYARINHAVFSDASLMRHL